MPIQVTCPECHINFLVGDEFAGRPGRCPECSAIIQVPDHEAVDSPPESQPIDTFEEFPRHSRRRRSDEEFAEAARSRNRSDERSRRPEFDPFARAAKWQKVSNGLRNLMVTVVLLSFQELIGTAFFIADGVRPAQQNNLGPRDQAMIIGSILVWTICLILWAMGRIAIARVPYVPARQLALTSAVFAGMTCASGVVGFGLVGAGALIIGQGNLNGLALANLGACALMPSMVGFVVAEGLGLWSQIRIGTALQDNAFMRTSRVLLIAFVSLNLFSCCAACALVTALMAELEKAQQQQLNNQNNPDVEPKDGEAAANGEGPKKEEKNALPPPRVVEDKNKNKAAPVVEKKGDAVAEKKPGPVLEKKDEPVAAKKDPGGKKKGQLAQKPGANKPPPIDPADHAEVVYAIRIGGLLLVLSYATLSVVCCQAGRRAIRREIEALTGSGKERDEHDLPKRW